MAEQHERGPELEVAADDTCVPAAWCPGKLHGGFKEPEDKPAPQRKESPTAALRATGAQQENLGPAASLENTVWGYVFSEPLLLYYQGRSSNSLPLT